MKEESPNIIDIIIELFDLDNYHDRYFSNDVDKRIQEDIKNLPWIQIINMRNIINKWEDHFQEGCHVGWSLPSYVPFIWWNIIDLYLESVKDRCPEFKILQIKLKFGGLRLYLKNIPVEFQQEVGKLEQKLFYENLIY